jgi:hypothetical protein
LTRILTESSIILSPFCKETIVQLPSDNSPKHRHELKWEIYSETDILKESDSKTLAGDYTSSDLDHKLEIHTTNLAPMTVPGTGLISPQGPVTGAATVAPQGVSTEDTTANSKGSKVTLKPHRHKIIINGYNGTNNDARFDFITEEALPNVKLWRGLQTGDMVRMLRIEQGRRYYVLERIVYDKKSFDGQSASFQVGVVNEPDVPELYIPNDKNGYIEI